MSQQVKDNERYGLGKAIGDKACHLFAKWLVSSIHLTRNPEASWGDFSYEVPYDSNAGRVLWRTGFLLKWASHADFESAEVVQPGRGKHGLNYIRVTNLRGMATRRSLPDGLLKRYQEICVSRLKTHQRQPHKVEIQRIQHAYLLDDFSSSGLHVAHFDDGLMHVGTTFCLNIGDPHCPDCPLAGHCEGYGSNRDLITQYRT